MKVSLALAQLIAWHYFVKKPRRTAGTPSLFRKNLPRKHLHDSIVFTSRIQVEKIGELITLTASERKINKEFPLPAVMGILNVTPDSFSDGGDYMGLEQAVAHGLQMAADGASFIDVGGESTRPGFTPVSAEEEMARVVPVIRELSQRISVPISIDTTKGSVALAALEAGASVINDVTGLTEDFDGMCQAIAWAQRNGVRARNFRVVLTFHPTLGEGGHFSLKTEMSEMTSFFQRQIQRIQERTSLESGAFVLDPGIGFLGGASADWLALREIAHVKALGYPVLVGASRKSFLGALTGRDPSQRLASSLAVCCYAVVQKVDILRVHDVAESLDAMRVSSCLWER